jgi:glycosyltransferase involved in cell wall biosynthesis
VKVLLLSAYAAHSHVHWQNTLQTMFEQWQWRILTLPPRHFSWRIRGNALYWSAVERGALEDTYDLLVATSMTDLATLRGLVPALARVPTVLYFHENQFEYPQDSQQHNLVEAQITSLYSALAADCIVFNSHYNHDSFMAGCAALLHRLPDYVPPEVVPRLRERAAVLPVPYDDIGLVPVAPQWPGACRQGVGRPLRLLWVGRFEHDKGADGLLRILRHLEDQGLQYELAMTGQQFRRSPPVFEEIRSAFGHRLVHFGFLPSATRYHALLQAADVVLSTAQHEFQGLAVMEAVARGCLPVVPRRLVYPEIYPAQCCYDSHPDALDLEAASAVALIKRAANTLPIPGASIPDLSAYRRHQLSGRYEQLFRAVVAAQDSH